MPVHKLRKEQLIRRPRAEVFDFFSRPENLARVTPPKLGFEILTPSPIEMKEGALVDYRIRLLGVPLRWRTLITAYEPPRRFVDEQLKGPYSFWHHTHEFEEVPEGTLVRDEVRYSLPLGALGDLFAGRFVAADLEEIFRYRRKVIASVFPERDSVQMRTQPMNIVLAGGSGFIGGALIDALMSRGDKVTLLTRNPEAARTRWGAKVSPLAWDGKNDGDWTKAVDGADAVINLSGESIANGRWSPARKLQLIKSRVDSTRALVAAISVAARRPKVLVSASAVGYYGGAPEGASVESAPQGRDFLAALCGQWEREALAAEPLGVRVALPRIGIVLEEDGGALAKMALPFKMFAGGPLGSGRQGFPWIHRDDVVAALLFLVDDEKISGPVNFAAPGAVNNKEFSAALGRALGRPSWAPAPAFALKIALGEMADMLLGGQVAPPKKLLDAGYRFKYPDADPALAAIYG
ncbi:MAG: TIGR01777 family oxidoreductase [Elusimicrobiota bacterium]